jgi:hypothetical protein
MFLICVRCANRSHLGLPGAYRRGGGGSSASPLHPWLDVANKPVVILSGDVEHERGRTFVGCVVTICDLRRGGVCDRGIPSVSCVKHWSWMLTRRSHGPVYSGAADVGFNVLWVDP